MKTYLDFKMTIMTSIKKFDYGRRHGLQFADPSSSEVIAIVTTYRNRSDTGRWGIVPWQSQ